MYKTPYKMGKRNTTQPDSHWEELDLDYTITKPTIICLGGNGTKTPEQANYICKVAQNLIGLKDKTIENEWPTVEDVDVIGISYGEGYFISSLGNARLTGQGSSLSNDEREQIVSQLFTPLIARNNQRLSTEDAMQNISLITFFSFCQGAFETQSLLNKLEQQMLHFGYRVPECEQILKQVVSVSYAPSTTISNVTRFDIKSFKDFMFSFSHDYEVDCGKNFLTLSGNELVRDTDKYNNPNGMSLYSDNLANNFPYINEHHLSIIERNDTNWVLEKQHCNEIVYLGKNADEASQCAGYVLSSSVVAGLKNQINGSFTPKPDINSLYNDCCSIIGQSPITATTEIDFGAMYVSEK